MVSGVWITREQYRMTDARTGTTKMIFVPGAGHSDLVPQDELEDIVLEYREIFEESLKDKPDHMTMPQVQQHDLGKTLKEIRVSKQRQAVSLHGKWWVKE